MLQFEAKELSRASREVIRRKLERLVKEFNDLATLDADLKPGERESVGLVIGLRPYVLSLFNRMQRRKAKPTRR
jgi:ribosome-associated translation inhibitor RaiA